MLNDECIKHFVKISTKNLSCQTQCQNDQKCNCQNKDCKELAEIVFDSPCFKSDQYDKLPGWSTILPESKAIYEKQCQAILDNAKEIESEQAETALTLGLSIGGSIAIVLIIVVIVFVRKRRSRKKRKQAQAYGIGNIFNEVEEQQHGTYKRVEVTQNPSFITTTTASQPTNPSNNHHNTGSANSSGSANSGGLLLCDNELLTLQLNKDDVLVQRKIGSGANGDVYLGQYKNKFVAIKKLSYDLQRNCDRVKDFMEEIKILSRLNHPRIVGCLGAIWSNMQDLSVVMEYVDNGDLRNVIVSKKAEGLFRVWLGEKYQIAMDILEGLVYIHSMKIIHRDLKSRNVLMDQDYRAKLTDFGIARTREVWQESTMTGGIGTMFWMAPEVLSGSRVYDMSADIYSLGAILVELDTMDLPYATANVPVMEIPFRVSRNELRPDASSSCPSQVKEIIDMCLQFEASKRPSAIELHHLWSSIDKSTLS